MQIWECVAIYSPVKKSVFATPAEQSSGGSFLHAFSDSAGIEIVCSTTLSSICVCNAAAHAAELSQTVKALEADVMKLRAEANTAGRQADKAVAKLHALPKVSTNLQGPLAHAALLSACLCMLVDDCFAALHIICVQGASVVRRALEHCSCSLHAC